MCKDNIFSPFSIRCGKRILSFDRPALMGILNVTDDSFYDGGRYKSEDQIVDRVDTMLREGADIIDIGVVSSRPGALLLPPDVEASRLAPVVRLLRDRFPQAVLSVDTCFSLPAKAAVEAGADIINDISGGDFDKDMFQTVADLQVPYILMHNLATPDHMQDNPHYDDILQEVTLFLSERIHRLRLLGVADVIIDPGFGFAKTLDHNYQLFAQLPQLKELFPHTPLLVAVSRKSMIYKLLDSTPAEVLPGTTALHTAALMAGAQLLRVHDVAAARQAVEVVRAITNHSPLHS